MRKPLTGQRIGPPMSEERAKMLMEFLVRKTLERQGQVVDEIIITKKPSVKAARA